MSRPPSAGERATEQIQMRVTSAVKAELVDGLDVCDPCNGSGRVDGVDGDEPCPACRGAGKGETLTALMVGSSLAEVRRRAKAEAEIVARVKRNKRTRGTP